MLNSNNKLNLGETFNQEENLQDSFFPEITYENDNDNIIGTHNSTGEERYFINANNLNNTLNIKRQRQNSSKKTHTKFSYDNLKRASKHLLIESVIKFINDKIYYVYNGNIGDGFFKMQLMKLNQEQKKNSNVEFNQLFLNKTLKEILSQKITRRIKFYKEDHNKELINQLIEEKKEEFENLFNLTFIECLEHFVGIRKIEELNGLTLFSELKKQILDKYKKDGESFYKNLEFFMKEFKNKINNAKPRKRKEKNSQSSIDLNSN